MASSSSHPVASGAGLAGGSRRRSELAPVNAAAAVRLSAFPLRERGRDAIGVGKARYHLAISRARTYDVAMANMLIRNLDDQVARRLRLQARLKGVSLEQEARRILAESTTMTRSEVAARAAAIRARQKPHRSRAGALIRRDRDR